MPSASARQGPPSQMKWVPKAVDMEGCAPETGSTESRGRPTKGTAKDGGRQDGGTGGTSGLEAWEKSSENSKPRRKPLGTFGAVISNLHKAEDDGALLKLFGKAVVIPPQGVSKGLHLKLSGRHIGDQAAVELSEYIDKALTSLSDADKEGMWTNLELDNNDIGDTGLIALIDVLRNHSVSIRRARLYNNFISDHAGARLASAVRQQDHALEEAHLSHNRLTARTLVRLCLAVASKRPSGRVPCWIHLEHNLIAQPLQVLELLHNHAWITTCSARNRSQCAIDRCGLCTGKREIIPRVHLYLLTTQRAEAENWYIDMAELRMKMSKWWHAVGQNTLTTPLPYLEPVKSLPGKVFDAPDVDEEDYEEEVDNGTRSWTGSSEMPVLLGRAGMLEQTTGTAREVKDQTSNKEGDQLTSINLPVPPPPPPPPGLETINVHSDSLAEEGAEIGSEQIMRAKKGKNKISVESQILVEVSSSESSTSVDEASESSKAPSESDTPSDGKAAGQMLLSMLRVEDVEASMPRRPDPQPLSTDEYQLWAMQAREDREIGADEFNLETFGANHGCGWSFEENVAANEQLSCNMAAALHGHWSYRQVAESYGYQQIPRDTKMLRRTLQDMAELVQIQPWCLKEAVRYVMMEGWQHITWRNQYTALHLAAELGQADVMPMLVWLGADPEDVDNKGRTARDVATKMQHRQCVTMLDDLHNVCGHMRSQVLGNAAQRNPCLFYAMREALRFMDLDPLCLREAVWHLIVTGESVLPWYETTVLNMVAEFGRSDLIPMLFGLNADPHQVDARGQTAFDVAHANGNWGCIYGFKHGCVPSDKDDTDRSDREAATPKDAPLRLRHVPPPR